MRQHVSRGSTITVACGFLIALSACAGQPLSSTARAPSASLVNAGGAGWTTAPLGSQASFSSTTAPSLQAAPRPLSTSNINTSTLDRPQATGVADATRPPPPPPLDGEAPLSIADTTAPCPPDPCAPPPAPDPCDPCAPPPAPIVTGCQLPCTAGLSQWHIRAVGGIVFFEGDDPGEDCGYLGLDVGRTFCGCWGLDAFYRWNSGTFDTFRPSQAQPGQVVFGKDGGDWHHFGVKLTYESSFGNNSRLYWWAGAGPEYFTTSGYDDDDDGFGVFGELGLGYLVNQNWRIRAGVNIHGVDTKVTRRNPTIDGGKRRFLWLIAPVIEVEASF